jgi:hypothetical protein
LFLAFEIIWPNGSLASMYKNHASRMSNDINGTENKQINWVDSQHITFCMKNRGVVGWGGSFQERSQLLAYFVRH